jgi:hypothetical protein
MFPLLKTVRELSKGSLMFLNAWKNLMAWKKTPNRVRRSVRRQPALRGRLWLEALEDRCVPTIVFSNQYGTEQLLPQGGNTLSSPPVYFLFWGSYWQQGNGPQYQQQILNAAQTLLNTGYFSGQKQYGTDGNVIYGGYDNHSSDPPQNFTQNDITNTLHNDIDNNMLPESDATNHQALYVLVTPPGVISSQGKNVGGYNAYTYELEFDLQHGFSADDEVYCWVGGGTDPNTFNLDGYTYILSHELTEAITDPQSFRNFPNIGYNGYRVNPGANFPNPPPNSNQLCDYEAQNYTYRLNGVQVQSYWSNQDQNFIIPDGNQQDFLVDNGTLFVTGDQFGQNYDDTIYIGQTAQGGVRVDLNNEVAAFDPGAIKAIDVSTGGGNDTVYVTQTAANVPVNIQLGSGTDNVFVMPLGGLNAIQGPITVDGGIGQSTLTVEDGGNANPSSWTVTGSNVSRAGAAAISYFNVSNIVLNGGSGLNTFDVQGTETGGTTTINTGDACEDEVDVQADNGFLTVNDGAGANDITVVTQKPQNLDTIPALVTVHGQGDSDVLYADDRANANPSLWQVTGDSITRISNPSGGGSSGPGSQTVREIDYSALHTIALYGGNGGSAFYLSPLLENLDELPPDVRVYGHFNAANTLTVYDNNNFLDSLWDVTDDLVTRSHSGAAEGPSTATIAYQQIQTLTLDGGNGNNGFNLGSTAKPTTTLLNTGTGNDVINVGGSGKNRVLDNISGPVTVTGQGGQDTLNFDDQDSSSAYTFTLTATSVTRDNIALITYASLSSVVVNGGSGSNTFNVTGVSYLAPYTLYGGAGNDTVNLNNPDLSDNPNALHVVTFYGKGGTNTLNLNDQANAANGFYVLGANSLFETSPAFLDVIFDASLAQLNVNAGSGKDTFQIDTAPSATAVAINGGGGVNTLDYAGFLGDITVDLPLGVGTRLKGGFSNIQIVYGSVGNDLLVGDANTLALHGGSGRNILISGGGASSLFGGGGDSLLIAGTTDYDQNLVALDDFMTEWVRTDLTFHQRVSDLITGGASVPTNLPASVLKGTGFKLRKSTVHASQTPEPLTGGGGLDWFFWDPAVDTLINKKQGDFYTRIK